MEAGLDDLYLNLQFENVLLNWPPTIIALAIYVCCHQVAVESTSSFIIFCVWGVPLTLDLSIKSRTFNITIK